MRAYSLIGVLAAMMILMAALVPLIALQGRAFEPAHRRLLFPITTAIENDLARLEGSFVLRPGRIPGEDFVVLRRIARHSDHLILVTYEVSGKDGTAIFTCRRFLYRTT